MTVLIEQKSKRRGRIRITEGISNNWVTIRNQAIENKYSKHTH